MLPFSRFHSRYKEFASLLWLGRRDRHERKFPRVVLPSLKEQTVLAAISGLFSFVGSGGLWPLRRCTSYQTPDCPRLSCRSVGGCWGKTSLPLMSSPPHCKNILISSIFAWFICLASTSKSGQEISRASVFPGLSRLLCFQQDGDLILVGWRGVTWRFSWPDVYKQSLVAALLQGISASACNRCLQTWQMKSPRLLQGLK